MGIKRRDFLRAAAGFAAAGLGGGVAQAMRDEQQASGGTGGGGPLAIASGNGLQAVSRAWDLLQAGADPVDAVVAGVNVVEDDPEDHSVGYGGLPNEDGVVELDSCVMHGPTHKGGAVAALRNVRFPSRVAVLVMRRTDHVLLVGDGALRFARAHGFQEENLLTDEARRIWLKWKETHSDRDDWVRPEAHEESARRLRELGCDFTYGTITCLALTAGGDIGGCTTTSGLAYKIPGRVGDSPILGAGLYVDNEIGACGSTGRGEANLLNCSSFHVVELMGRGASPEEACRQVLQGIAKRTEQRLRDAQGNPNYGLSFYALRKDGRFGGATMRGTAPMAVRDGQAARRVDLPGLLSALPSDE